MNKDKQRIAIAKACGWTSWSGFATRKPWKSPAGESASVLPDYLNDLNAMHEAWATLSEQDRQTFQKALRDVILGDNPRRHGELSWLGEARISNATAAQRAEAFLRTLGKWEEAS